MLLAFLHARLNYVDIRSRSSTATQERVTELHAETTDLLKTKLKAYKLSLQEATDIMEMVGRSGMPDETKI